MVEGGEHNHSFNVQSMPKDDASPSRRQNQELQVQWQPPDPVPHYQHQEPSPNPLRILGRFHWTILVPYVYSFTLILFSCIVGYFSISGLVLFILFLLHGFAYFMFRGKFKMSD